MNLEKKENKLKDKLIAKVNGIFDELSVVAGYAKGSSPLKVSPAFIERKEDIKNLIFNKLCINNLSSHAYYLAGQLDGKIGLILKPCDTRAIIQLISEELIERDRFRIISVGCSGILDYKKVQKAAGGLKVISAEVGSNDIKVKTLQESLNLKTKDFYADKCYWCDISEDPPLFDEFIENDEKLDVEKKQKYEDIEKLEKLSLKEIHLFWEKEFSRCIRCYACRNICPLEVCRDQCIAHLDQPSWQSQKVTAKEGKFFQLIRAMHLAGRCVECGECERVCPVNLPVFKFMKKINKEIKRLFEFIPGISVSEKPPLLTFKNVEKNIKEEELV